MNRPTPFEREHYGKLVGCTVAGIRWEDYEGRPLPVLILRTKDGRTVMCSVMCDPEGNGPGHLEHRL